MGLMFAPSFVLSGGLREFSMNLLNAFTEVGAVAELF